MKTANNVTLSRISNVVSMISIALILGSTGFRYLSRRVENVSQSQSPSRAGQASTSEIERSFATIGVSFARNDLTVMILLEPTCAWNESVGDFYREIATSAVYASRVTAILPVDPVQGRSYLEQLGLPIRDVRQGRLPAVATTPALFIVDKKGRIKDSWLGTMTPSQKADARRQLGLKSFPDANDTTPLEESAHRITTSTALALLSHDAVAVLDIRPREDYQQLHVADSINIPVDELSVRAIHELPLNGPLLIICGPCPACDTADERKLHGLCETGAQQLTAAGFKGLRVLPDDPRTLDPHAFRIRSTAESTERSTVER